MGGRVVSDLPSDDKGDGENSPRPLFAYTEEFYKHFPFYLAIGMTYEQYWEQDCDLVKYYRKAMEIRQKLTNQQAWLQGLYVYEAIADLAPVLHAFAKKGTKPKPYTSKPYEFDTTKAEKAKRVEKQDTKARAYMEAFMVATNRKFEKGR